MYFQGQPVTVLGSDDNTVVSVMYSCINCGYHVQDANLKAVGGCSSCGKQFYRCPKCAGTMRARRVHVPDPEPVAKPQVAQPQVSKLPPAPDVIVSPKSLSHVVRSVERKDA